MNVVLSPPGVESQQHVVPREIAAERTNTFRWSDRTTTPDLMLTFRIMLRTAEEASAPAGLPADGMSDEDVSVLTDWLRSDSLDWEALERDDAWED